MDRKCVWEHIKPTPAEVWLDAKPGTYEHNNYPKEGSPACSHHAGEMEATGRWTARKPTPR